MGYRSDVGLAFTNDAFYRIYNRIPAGLKKDLEDAAAPTNIGSSSGTKSFFLSGVKWYDFSDQDLIKFMELLNELVPESYGFIRVGEDYEDVEMKGFPFDFDMDLVRGIKFY